MNREDLLFEYFEGELNNSQEELLFEQLQNDNSLRVEFNQQMRILMLAKQDAGFVTAPLESAESIFGTLNINSHHFYSVKRKERFLRFVNSTKVKKTAISAMVLLLSFIGAFYTYDYSKQYFQSSNQESIQNAKYPIVSSTAKQSSNYNLSTNDNGSFFSDFSKNQINKQQFISAVLKANAEELSVLERKYKNKEAELYAIIEKLRSNEFINDSNNSGSEDFVYNQEMILLSPAVNNNKSKTSNIGNLFLNNTANNLSLNSFRPGFIQLSQALSNLFTKNSKFVVSFRNNMTNTASPVLNSQLVEGNSSNYEIQFGYNFDNNQQVDLVVGRENFPQKFTRNIDGQQYLQIQNPSMYFIGAGYKYTLNNLFYQTIAAPYFQGLFAGTSIGPYMKLQTGLELNLLKQLSVFAGIENGILIYNVDNNIYSTNKVNFVYGMNIKF